MCAAPVPTTTTPATSTTYAAHPHCHSHPHPHSRPPSIISRRSSACLVRQAPSPPPLCTSSAAGGTLSERPLSTRVHCRNCCPIHTAGVQHPMAMITGSSALSAFPNLQPAALQSRAWWRRHAMAPQASVSAGRKRRSSRCHRHRLSHQVTPIRELFGNWRARRTRARLWRRTRHRRARVRDSRPPPPVTPTRFRPLQFQFRTYWLPRATWTRARRRSAPVLSVPEEAARASRWYRTRTRSTMCSAPARRASPPRRFRFRSPIASAPRLWRARPRRCHQSWSSRRRSRCSTCRATRPLAGAPLPPPSSSSSTLSSFRSSSCRCRSIRQPTQTSTTFAQQMVSAPARTMPCSPTRTSRPSATPTLLCSHRPFTRTARRTPRPPCTFCPWPISWRTVRFQLEVGRRGHICGTCAFTHLIFTLHVTCARIRRAPSRRPLLIAAAAVARWSQCRDCLRCPTRPPIPTAHCIRTLRPPAPVVFRTRSRPPAVSKRGCLVRVRAEVHVSVVLASGLLSSLLFIL